MLDQFQRESSEVGRRVLPALGGYLATKADPFWGAVYSFLWPVLQRLPFARTLSGQEAHYRTGRKLLRAARKSVIVLSTLKNEDLTKSAKRSTAMRAYFVELQRRVYRNRHEDPVKVTRFVDLNDADKCGEAVSLLYYGAGVEIRHSKSPVEFLAADDRTVMVGFPSEQKLSRGFVKFGNERMCQGMKEWIEEFNPPSGKPLRARSDLGNLAMCDGHDDDCMCKVIPLLGRASKLNAEAFDEVAGWYPDLYVQTETDEKYGQLVRHWIDKGLINPANRLRFLDIGCGPGSGALVLANTFDYWGIDASARMVAKTSSSDARFIKGDVFDILLGVHPERKIRKRLPKSFSVIACQGNTFDHFLGLPQKELALYLIDEHLESGGLLFVTGSRFDSKKTRVEREITTVAGTARFHYGFEWSGNYAAMDVPRTLTNQDERVTFLIHRHTPSWFGTMVIDALKYEEVSPGYPGKWFGPQGADPYDIQVFRKP